MADPCIAPGEDERLQGRRGPCGGDEGREEKLELGGAYADPKVLEGRSRPREELGEFADGAGVVEAAHEESAELRQRARGRPQGIDDPVAPIPPFKF